jgi:hypothetical protein
MLQQYRPLPPEYERLSRLPSFIDDMGEKVHYDEKGSLFKLDQELYVVIALRLGHKKSMDKMKQLWKDSRLYDARFRALRRKALVTNKPVPTRMREIDPVVIENVLESVFSPELLERLHAKKNRQ